MVGQRRYDGLAHATAVEVGPAEPLVDAPHAYGTAGEAGVTGRVRRGAPRTRRLGGRGARTCDWVGRELGVRDLREVRRRDESPAGWRGRGPSTQEARRAARVAGSAGGPRRPVACVVVP